MGLTGDPVIDEYRDMLINSNYLNDYGCYPESKLFSDEIEFEEECIYGGTYNGDRYHGLRFYQISLLDAFIEVRMKEKKELKKQLKKDLKEQLKKARREEKQLKKARREEKKLKKAKMADITKGDGDGVVLKSYEVRCDEMKSVVDQQRDVVLLNEQVGNLMEGVLKRCAREAEKKNVAHSKND